VLVRKLSSARPQLGRAEPSFSTTDQHFCQVEMLHKFSVPFSQIFVQIAQIKIAQIFYFSFVQFAQLPRTAAARRFSTRFPFHYITLWKFCQYFF
jgi:hypothetical protein